MSVPSTAVPFPAPKARIPTLGAPFPWKIWSGSLLALHLAPHRITQMKLFRHVLPVAALAVAGAANFVQAQELQPCLTDEMRQLRIEANPDLLRMEAEYEQSLQDYLQARKGLRDDDDHEYVIPVVFHVLYNPNSATDGHNISDAQIHDAINILNRDFAKMNADTVDICCGFDQIAAATRIRFQLATKDPFGNCTNGIDRINSLRSTGANDFAKLNSWFREHYLNIWVVQSLQAYGDGFQPAGYATLPGGAQDGAGSLLDGVILVHSYIGSIGTGNPTRARALTHEVGHYLNLQHTWGGGHSPGEVCGDDGVDDTPLTRGHGSCHPVLDMYDFFCSAKPFTTVYDFNGVNSGTGSTDPFTPWPAYADSLGWDPAVNFGQAAAVGVSANTMQDGKFSFSQWDLGAPNGASDPSELTGSINTSKYYTITLTPELGKAMTFTGLNFKVGRSGNGPRSFSVRSSIDNFGSNLPLTVDTNLLNAGSNTAFFRRDTTGTLFNVKMTTPSGTHVNLIEPVTFRIYAWNSEEDDGWFTLEDLAVKGSYGIIENTQNFMEYSYCDNMFTYGQKERMEAALENSASGRNNLWTDANHQYTGVAGYENTCGPEADFYALDHFVCMGQSVRFKANVKRAEATSWHWTFEGGNPATSDQQNPVVTFNEVGPRFVTLTVSNDDGTSTAEKYAVWVGADWPEKESPVYEPFNSQQDFDLWPVKNWENNQSRWHWDSQVGHWGPGSAKLNASNTYTLVQDLFQYDVFRFKDVDVLLTPTLDLSYLHNIQVSFWYAASTLTSNVEEITENLKVYASFNCGETWTNAQKTLSGATLITAGVRDPGHVPQADEWREATFNLSNAYARDHVRLKFEYTSSLSSNDLYIDDINITGTNVGIGEIDHSGYLSLMPNPATNNVTVHLDLAGNANGTLSFMDMTGRVVYVQDVKAGVDELTLDLDRMGLTSGVYLVRLGHDKGQRVERLVVR